MQARIIPTNFALSKEEFMKKLNILLPIANEIQVDFMDGVFVQATSVGIDEIPDLSLYNKFFEAHLMVANPEKFIDKLSSKGFKKILFHYEALSEDKEKILSFISTIKSKSMKVFLACNPETEDTDIEEFAGFVDGVLFMGIHPGKEQQELIPDVLASIKRFRERHPDMDIQIDGGVNANTAKEIMEAGANILNSGSYVTGSDNPKAALDELNSIIRGKDD